MPERRTRQPKFPKCGQVRDIHGDLWDVRDVRLTRHGFDLYFGTPANIVCTGRAPLIATQALWDFWNDNSIECHGLRYELPAGRTTLKRMRRRLGFNLRLDTTDFWEARLEDLEHLPPREFAARHGVNKDVAFDWRCKLLGRFAREQGWWRHPKVLAVLLSPVTLCVAGRKLGITFSHAKRLRDRAMLEALQRRGALIAPE